MVGKFFQFWVLVFADALKEVGGGALAELSAPFKSWKRARHLWGLKWRRRMQGSYPSVTGRM